MLCNMVALTSPSHDDILVYFKKNFGFAILTPKIGSSCTINFWLGLARELQIGSFYSSQQALSIDVHYNMLTLGGCGENLTNMTKKRLSHKSVPQAELCCVTF